VECLGVAIDCSTLYSTEPEQAEESLLAEPIFPPLCSENIEQRFAFAPGRARAQRHVQIWLAEISVPLRNLVFENELVTEGVPRQVGHYPVVLVPVVARVGKDDIRSKLAGETLERILDRVEMGREIAVAEFVQADCLARCWSKELPRSALGLTRTVSSGAPDNPSEFRSRSSARQLRQRATAANLDVVRVCADAKDFERRCRPRQAQP
jgi:hypothetical protein